MNRRTQSALLGLALCLGTACSATRTARNPPASAQVARPLTPARSSDGNDGRGEVRDRAGDSQSPSAVEPTPNADAPRPLVRRTQKWNPVWWFGNVDDPVPPDWYRPGSRWRTVFWQLRNPLHNFTFYVLGVADREFTRTGKFPEAVFAPDCGWNWAVTRCGWVRLPFLSFNGERGRFYLGWRERGNFGGKVNFGKLPTPDPRRQTPNPAPE